MILLCWITGKACLQTQKAPHNPRALVRDAGFPLRGAGIGLMLDAGGVFRNGPESGLSNQGH
jgi:hypothetical protein